ncbi:MAG: hypothetical protein WC814_02870 [Candidatus Paceibacterota bacterium]|jgi:hypothetical protein
MNHHIDPVKTGLSVGAFLGGLHLVWSLLVAFGWAQALVDFVLWMHMINLPYVVTAFDLSAATTLVVITALFGCVLGYFYARIWNRVHRVEV